MRRFWTQALACPTAILLAPVVLIYPFALLACFYAERAWARGKRLAP
jgi:hypothetical protein